jgi:hypothetical protein
MLTYAQVSWYKGAWPTQQGSVQLAHWLLWPVIAAAFRLVELIFAVQVLTLLVLYYTIY